VHRRGHLARRSDKPREGALQILIIDTGELRVLLNDGVDLLRVRAVGDPRRLELGDKLSMGRL
jgi:hypothetical protein